MLNNANINPKRTKEYYKNSQGENTKNSCQHTIHYPCFNGEPTISNSFKITKSYWFFFCHFISKMLKHTAQSENNQKETQKWPQIIKHFRVTIPNLFGCFNHIYQDISSFINFSEEKWYS